MNPINKFIDLSVKYHFYTLIALQCEKLMPNAVRLASNIKIASLHRHWTVLLLLYYCIHNRNRFKTWTKAAEREISTATITN